VIDSLINCVCVWGGVKLLFTFSSGNNEKQDVWLGEHKVELEPQQETSGANPIKLLLE
jgi:hypothetical protein